MGIAVVASAAVPLATLVGVRDPNVAQAYQASWAQLMSFWGLGLGLRAWRMQYILRPGGPGRALCALCGLASASLPLWSGDLASLFGGFPMMCALPSGLARMRPLSRPHRPHVLLPFRAAGVLGTSRVVLRLVSSARGGQN